MSQFFTGNTAGNNPFGPVNVTIVTGPITYTVLPADQFILVDTTVGSATIALPNSNTSNRIIVIIDIGGKAKTNIITVTTIGGAVLIDGATSNIIDSNYGSIDLVYSTVKAQYYTW